MEDLNTKAGSDSRPGTYAVPNFPLRYTLNRISTNARLDFQEIHTYLCDGLQNTTVRARNSVTLQRSNRECSSGSVNCIDLVIAKYQFRLRFGSHDTHRQRRARLVSKACNGIREKNRRLRRM
jgi:hypothetical protein